MNVRLPNGQVLRNVPEGTTRQHAMVMGLQQGLLTPEDLGSQSEPATGTYTENLLAGAGKAFVDMGRGTRQLLNIGDQDALQREIDEAAQRDAQLLDAPGGTMGFIGGNVAAAAPAMFVPGVNRLAGATAAGAAMGAMAPTASDQNPMISPAMGAAGGAVGTMAGRAIEGGVRGAGALLAPMTESGQRAIAGRALRRAATDPDSALMAARTYRPETPGVRPTLGEATLDPGLVSMQKAIPDPALAGEVAQQHAANREVVLDVLRDIAGTPLTRDAAVQARRSATEPLYAMLEGVQVPMDDTLAELLARPAVAAAYRQARTNARNRGQDMPPLQELLAVDEGGNYLGMLDGRTLQRLKQAMSANYQGDVVRGVRGDTLDASRSVQEDLMAYARENLPGYAQADDTFRRMSAPINEMDAGRYLYERVSPAINEYGDGVSRMRPQALAQALRDGQSSLPRQLRDIPGARQLSDVLSPGNQQRVQGVMSDLAREAQAYDTPLIRGSDTMRNLSSQNVMRETLGPLGMPEGVSDALMSGASGTARALNMMLGGAEPNVQALIVRALRDPSFAADLMQATAGTPLGDFISGALRSRAGVPAAAAGASLPAAEQ